MGAAPGSCLLTVVLLPTVSPGVPEMSFQNKKEDDTGTVAAPVLTRTRRDLGFISFPSWGRVFPELTDVPDCFLPDPVLGHISELRV